MRQQRNCRGLGGKGWWLSSIILLLIAEKPSYGYELVERLKEFGITLIGNGNMGRIYTFLSDFETNDLITFNWDTTYSPPRKIYTITDKGLEFLSEIKKEMDGLKNTIEIYEKKYNTIAQN
ncbi:PadR family transcriptional regulator [Tepiditoga spiralis]|uniref:PadR family transcriptional regulator n=1 Tax=Tepiditoga spiralis TaxID=2108365 RepID=A0A7G1G893_9BACT|nr:PadR family transcriptional regulator [Tepiditoga spiralis]BBE31444.1 PadR family transcriptional regulator [Tepiditoga spiralis]